MTREQVDLMLSEYREKSARCAHLEQEVKQLEKLVEELKRTIIDDEVKTTSVLSDMPKGTMTSDPTGRLGILLAEGFEPKRIREIEIEIEEKKREVRNIEPTVIFVRAWLSGLNDREKFLIESKVIDNNYWRIVIDGYQERFGEAYSKQGLKNITCLALEKIYRIAV